MVVEKIVLILEKNLSLLSRNQFNMHQARSPSESVSKVLWNQDIIQFSSDFRYIIITPGLIFSCGCNKILLKFGKSAI